MSGLLLGTVGVRHALSFGLDVQQIPSEQSASRKLACRVACFDGVGEAVS